MITKNTKLIQPNTMVVGVDIAKRTHWAVVMYEGMPVGKAFAIPNTQEGFQDFLYALNALKQKLGAHSVMVGMEPTGHYFKPLAYFLANTGMCKVVLVNPYHVNRSKELEDNSPSKNDKKDARVIARLVSQGNYLFASLGYGVWAELRSSNVERLQLIKKRWQLKNQLTTILDQFFPEFTDVFKDILGNGARHVLTHYPFPADILEVEEQTLCKGLKEATNNRVGQKRAQKLRETALHSVGIKEGVQGARIQVFHLVEQLGVIQRQIRDVEIMMAEQLKETGLGEYLTSIPGVGLVSAAAFLAEIGNPDDYENYKQVQKKAGLNLKENSSGQHKGKTSISKRGRPSLRQLMYQIALVSVARNPEMKNFYRYLTTRQENPLAGKQAIIAVAVKMIKVMLAVCKKREYYDGSRVGNGHREAGLQAA